MTKTICVPCCDTDVDLELDFDKPDPDVGIFGATVYPVEDTCPKCGREWDEGELNTIEENIIDSLEADDAYDGPDTYEEWMGWK